MGTNEWALLQRGDSDPYYSRMGNYCRDEHNRDSKGWCCTRMVGHIGLHVASTGMDHVCHVWGNPDPAMQLPEGF